MRPVFFSLDSASPPVITLRPFFSQIYSGGGCCKGEEGEAVDATPSPGSLSAPSEVPRSFLLRHRGAHRRKNPAACSGVLSWDPTSHRRLARKVRRWNCWRPTRQWDGTLPPHSSKKSFSHTTYMLFFSTCGGGGAPQCSNDFSG
jgi:hypothetical protein